MSFEKAICHKLNSNNCNNTQSLPASVLPAVISVGLDSNDVYMLLRRAAHEVSGTLLGIVRICVNLAVYLKVGIQSTVLTMII